MTTETRATTVRRYWRRTSSARPWWPWGLLPLLGLGLLFLIGALYVAPHIERDVTGRVLARLEGSAVANAAVGASGQGVTVLATAPQSDATAIQALAKSTQCDTWAGELTCPTTVDLQLREPPVVAAPPRIHDFEFTRDADTITLRGEVPNSGTRDRLLGLAKERFSQVIDKLRISNESATEMYTLAAERSLQVLQTFQQGTASWTNAELSASGLTTADLADDARTRFHDPNAAPSLGEIEVRVAKDADQCDEEFAAMLKKSSIRFRTASADIDAGNEDLLENLADLAERCPGSLKIEGHTDSMGDAGMNRALSLARATSVRNALVELGINTDRLHAKGYGESQPLADNGTASGRARNRRIVISTQLTD